MKRFPVFKSLFVGGIISLSFLLWQAPVLAAATMGSISAFEGDVELERGGKVVPVKLNMDILPKDKIKVKTGMAEVAFLDESIIRLKSNTEMSIDLLKRKQKIKP